MLLRAGFTSALSLVLLLFGCRSEGSDPGPAPRPDSGRRDAGNDSGPRPDAPPPPDAGPPDGGPMCTCPPLPELCAMPAVDVPAFGPSDSNEILGQLIGLISCADTTLQITSYEATFACLVDAVAARLDADPDLMVDVVIDDGQCPVEMGRLSCEWNALEMHPRVRIVAD